ncbi:outer membrane beta-barrel protein [Mangrovimonas spongiae]|uniref:Cell envelope biogenesis protein OmpA n=1 Tax=Mangrovimonas spongiae TaxID=2494697 RepID=A0A428K5Z0_9FLAO|nr:outer membrane beta-barrel protein [Mangrovimonas spongiae]RSK41874.1 cell envelope biogenesis protein OmpA [Mangrovimonas spongiae]
MTRTNKKILSLSLFILITAFGFSQRTTSKWKAQLALGVNSPSQSGFVYGFEGKSINFPTVNLGIQHMFKRQIGAKLDYGFNRISNQDNTPEFKLNYSRINAQFVYDPTPSLHFLPFRMGVVTHAGPGFSFVKPLSVYTDNNTSFFNVMAGLEIHYGITERLSIYTDVSYIYGVSKDFDLPAEGYGSFNGNLLTITAGVTFSLSGCQYCD